MKPVLLQLNTKISKNFYLEFTKVEINIGKAVRKMHTGVDALCIKRRNCKNNKENDQDK